jgi:hypothetical protein
MATVEEYDPAANSWKSVRPMLVARNHHMAVGAGGKIYVIGGRIGAGFISSASNNIDLVEMYDPAADLWTPRTRMPTARSAIAGRPLQQCADPGRRRRRAGRALPCRLQGGGGL